MNQEENRKELIVKLFKDNENDFLEFNLGRGKKHTLNINLEDNQGEIKAMFCDLVPLIEVSLVEFVLSVEDSYDNRLLKEVSESYIEDLNKEIVNVRAEILDKYETDEE